MISTVDPYGWEDIGSTEYAVQDKFNTLFSDLADLLQVKFEAEAAESIAQGKVMARRPSDGKLVVADPRYSDRTPPVAVAEQAIAAGEFVRFVTRGSYRKVSLIPMFGYPVPAWLYTRDLYLLSNGSIGIWSDIPQDGVPYYLGRMVRDADGDPVMLFNPVTEHGFNRRGSMTKFVNLSNTHVEVATLAFTTYTLMGGQMIWAPTTSAAAGKPAGLWMHCDHGFSYYTIEGVFGVATLGSVAAQGLQCPYDMGFAAQSVSSPRALSTFTGSPLAVDPYIHEWSGDTGHSVTMLSLTYMSTIPEKDSVTWHDAGLGAPPGSTDYAAYYGNDYYYKGIRPEVPVSVGTIGVTGTIWFLMGDKTPEDE